MPALFLAVGVTLLAVRRLFPWLHNVPANPFEQLIRTTRDAGLFSVVAIVAGGLREEVQRAFLLRRFSTHLGGPAVGLAVTSVAFGAGHLMQGFDAAVATGLLGFAWGLMYLRRRAPSAPSSATRAYNGTQVLQLLLLRGDCACRGSATLESVCSGGVLLTPARARNPCTHSATTAS